MNTVLSAQDISRALSRIAHEICESNTGSQSMTLLGIPTRGAHLAFRLATLIESIEGSSVQVGTLDTTLFRDDLRLKAPRALMATKIPPLGVQGRTVVLVDDVLFSGRTIRAALDALGDIGRPSRVQLATLIDRGHRELPIRADFVGKNIPTALSQSVRVSLTEIDGVDEVTISDLVSS
jgi:pyrimidine operon attenuation protein / uracil phosphoribosyltransferase|uniref:bifunctional pyr operon transcriptional regulator/uracil phosphoribosyltransferase PyrR n=1 Tax=Candidatus Planktophila sp. TaxID=2175601 RepID=UPI0040493604